MSWLAGILGAFLGSLLPHPLFWIALTVVLLTVWWIKRRQA